MCDLTFHISTFCIALVLSAGNTYLTCMILMNKGGTLQHLSHKEEIVEVMTNVLRHTTPLGKVNWHHVYFYEVKTVRKIKVSSPHLLMKHTRHNTTVTIYLNLSNITHT